MRLELLYVISNLHKRHTDPIYFEKRSICIIFCSGDCFTSLSWRYLAELGMEVKTQNMREKFKSSFMQKRKLREIMTLMGLS